MKQTALKTVAGLVGAALVAGSASAGAPVEVTISGTVQFNGIGTPPLSGVSAGQTALMSFLVNSNNFVDSVPGDVRGYVIDLPSFSLSFSGGVSVGLLDPFPGTAYFGLVNGFPVSDGFFVSSSPNSPGGVPLEQAPYQANFSVGYTGGTLSSLNILDAVGTYDFTGLTNFGFNLWAVVPDNVVLDMEFTEMTITVVPAPAALAVLAPALVLRRRRRG